MAKRVFLSQPMGGRLPEEIEKERAEAVEVVEGLYDEVEVVDSYFGPEGGRNPLDDLGKSLQLMSTADVVAFCPGWESARGCRIERQCATQYGYSVLDLDKYMD